MNATLDAVKQVSRAQLHALVRLAREQAHRLDRTSLGIWLAICELENVNRGLVGP